MHLISRSRVEVTVTTYKKVCPYCKARPIRKRTCGNNDCQYKHHILQMRKDRKTDRKSPTRTVNTISLAS